MTIYLQSFLNFLFTIFISRKSYPPDHRTSPGIPFLRRRPPRAIAITTVSRPVSCRRMAHCQAPHLWPDRRRNTQCWCCLKRRTRIRLFEVDGAGEVGVAMIWTYRHQLVAVDGGWIRDFEKKNSIWKVRKGNTKQLWPNVILIQYSWRKKGKTIVSSKQ